MVYYNIESEVPGLISGVLDYWVKNDPQDLANMSFAEVIHAFKLAHPKFLLTDEKLDRCYTWFVSESAKLSVNNDPHTGILR